MSAESDYKCSKCGYEWVATPPSECPKCSTHSLQRPCSAPLWYTAEELRHYLTAFGHYSDEIAAELASDYSRNLQRAFEKGWEMAMRKQAQNNGGER